MATSPDLDRYLTAFRTLKVNRRGGRASPHKPCMLLAVLGLAEAGKLDANEIRFDPPLLERYAALFKVVRGPADHLNPYFPFFHLRGDEFWHLQPKPGREPVLNALPTVRSIREVEENIEFARVDPELHALMLQPEARKALRDELVTAWFGSYAEQLNRFFRDERSADQYESDLRKQLLGEKVAPELASEAARSTAFRRIVSEAYDYRCAASGWRIILPDTSVLVEAAHLIPFAESHDDDPRNGIALAPTFHWALDRHVIAPGADLKWHISEVLDERLPENRPLLDLAGKPIFLPRDRALWPKTEALKWRVTRLLKS